MLLFVVRVAEREDKAILHLWDGPKAKHGPGPSQELLLYFPHG